MYKRLILTFVLCLSLTALAQASGPIAYYPFDGDLSDAIGSNDGVFWTGGATSASPTLTADHNGNANKALTLDGDQAVIMPNESDFDVTGSLTLSYWIYTDSDGILPAAGGFNNNKVNVSKSTGAPAQPGFYSRSNWYSASHFSRINFRVNNTTAGVPWNSSTYSAAAGDSTNPDGMDPEVWYHIVLTWNADTGVQRIYQDGVLNIEKQTSFTTANGYSIESTDAPFAVGCFALSDYTPSTVAWGVKIDIDEVAIWDRALSADTVAFIYANGVPEPATLTLLGLGSLSLLYRKRKA